MNYIKHLRTAAFVIAFLAVPHHATARQYIYDWYVKDFQTQIVVNTDSSIIVTESITADCGDLPGKHGIYRVVPYRIRTKDGNINTPIKLISITDFNYKPLKYSTIHDKDDKTISWKIGDRNRTVRGENHYLIKYLVKNAVRCENKDFDELYWNLSGNFWKLEIDKFSADVIFPEGIGDKNSKAQFYSGYVGDKGNNLADYTWLAGNVLHVDSKRTMSPGEGITAAVLFPKNIFTPYVPSIMEKYGEYAWFLISLASFMICYILWRIYGKDPVINRSITPEFSIPGDLTPIQMGLLEKSGKFHNDLISAAIINMAVKGYIAIEERKREGLFAPKDYLIERLGIGSNKGDLGKEEYLLISKLFEGRSQVLLSSLENKFYKHLSEVEEAALKEVADKKGLVSRTGLSMRAGFLVTAIIFGFLFFPFMAFSMYLSGNMLLSGAIVLFFAVIMPQRTPKGAELEMRVKGFRMYLDKAEKYRQQFFEDKGIFEKMLPYAMVFGMARQWMKKMADIYGSEYYNSYRPVWYVGSFSGGFNADTFASQLNSVSDSIASNVSSSPSSSGSGGGSSGGGGGGGGGGGW